MYINGEKTHINTRVSYGHREISDYLITTMAKQMKITRKEFEEFVSCKLTEDGYRDILVNKGEIEVQHQYN